MKLFCVECGKETDDLLNGMCIDCYIKHEKLVKIPGRLHLTICPTCGSVRYKREWKKKEFKDAVKEVVEKAIVVSPYLEKREIEIDLIRKGKTLYECKIFLNGSIKGKPVNSEVYTELLVEKKTCLTCSRKAGKYFEAIIQLRTEREEEHRFREVLEELKAFIREYQLGGRDVFITNIKEVKGGIDVYLSDNHLAKKIAQDIHSRYGGEKKASPKLVGLKDGKRVYRVTYLIRLPSYTTGDILSDGKDFYYLKSMDGKKVHIVNLMNWLELTCERKFMKNFSVVGSREMIKEAIVVSQSKEEIQVMDPDNYKTIELKKPRSVHFGRTVRIVKTENGIFLLPTQKL